MPVVMFSSRFLLTTADSPNGSGVADSGRRPGVGKPQPGGGDGMSLVSAGGRNCAVQTVHERGVAEEVFDDDCSAEEAERYGVYGDGRPVVDSAYLFAAIEFEAEVDRLACNEYTRTLAAKPGVDGTSVTMFSSIFLLIKDDELAESRHALNDHIQARRRKKRLRKGVSVSGSLLA